MMRLHCVALCVAAFIAGSALGADLSAVGVVIEDFERYAVGETPGEGWRAREGDPKGVYRVVEEEGNRFLRARDTGHSVQFFLEKGWDIQTYPCLTWRWRVHRFPEGADERVTGSNDSAAGLYVLFPRRFFVPEAIKYVWSNVVPVGTKVVRRQRFPTFIVRSGAEGLGVWKTERRCVASDYLDHFGRRSANPVAVGFLTDANDVNGVAEADYDDIRAVPVQAGDKP